MRIQPVSIRQPEIDALVADRMSLLVRPIGRLATLGAGDLLWVREPFYVPRAFSAHKPTRAVELGAKPTFLVDHSPAWFARHAADFGLRQAARVMPKAWHRQHLVIGTVDRVRLQNLSADEFAAAGWSSRDAFRRRWDADADFGGQHGAGANLWAANPTALRIRFARVAAPLPSES
jgi:hypothetical protein